MDLQFLIGEPKFFSNKPPFGDNLKQLRGIISEIEEREISAEEFATLFGVPLARYEWWEKSERYTAKIMDEISAVINAKYGNWFVISRDALRGRRFGYIVAAQLVSKIRCISKPKEK